jgi:hypothetical protein
MCSINCVSALASPHQKVRESVESSLPFICLMKHEIISRFFSALAMHHDEAHLL